MNGIVVEVFDLEKARASLLSAGFTDSEDGDMSKVMFGFVSVQLFSVDDMEGVGIGTSQQT